MSKVRILFLSANPRDKQNLKLKKEYDDIKLNIENSPNKELVELIPAWDVQPYELVNYILDYKPHIVHFGGHGDSNGIIFINEEGNSKPVRSEALTRIFRRLGKGVKLVVINTCYSYEQAKLIAQAIGCAVGMTRDISDEGAIIFVASFYKMIAFGYSIGSAFDVSKVKLQLSEYFKDSDFPKLLSGSNVDPEEIILVRELYRGGWLLSKPDLWNSYLTIISFVKNVHHTFQILDMHHLNELTKKIDEINKTRHQKIGDLNSIQSLWGIYADEYQKFEQDYLQNPFREKLVEAFNVLQRVDNLKVQSELYEAHKYYQSIYDTLNANTHIYQETKNLLESKESNLFKVLSDQNQKMSFYANIFGLSNYSKLLVVNADNLLKKLIEATEIGG